MCFNISGWCRNMCRLILLFQMAEIDVTEPKMVKVYYCQCGQSIEKVSVLAHAETNRASKKEFKDAAKWGRKVETMTLEEFHTKSFMHVGIPDCPDPDITRYYPKRPTSQKPDN